MCEHYDYKKYVDSVIKESKEPINISNENKYEVLRTNHYEVDIRTHEDDIPIEELRHSVKDASVHTNKTSELVDVKFHATMYVVNWINTVAKANIASKYLYNINVIVYNPDGSFQYCLTSGEYYIDSIVTKHDYESKDALLFEVKFIKNDNKSSLVCEHTNPFQTSLNLPSYIPSEKLPETMIMSNVTE